MFVILVISLLILSHVMIDYYILSDREAKKLDNRSILKYSVIFLVCSLVLTIAFFSFYLSFIIIAISIFYLGLQKLKIIMSDEEQYLRTFILFVSDQLTRLTVLFGAYPFLKHIEPNQYMLILFNRLLSWYPFLEVLQNINLLAYVILVIAGFLFAIRSSTRLSLIIINLPKAYKSSSNKENSINKTSLSAEQEVAAASENNNTAKDSQFIDEERMKRYGKMIGNIERVIIISAILLSQYQIIIIITAIKSIGRFKEITKKTSDYYIIGNFASFSIAFLIGFTLLAVKRVLLG